MIGRRATGIRDDLSGTAAGARLTSFCARNGNPNGSGADPKSAASYQQHFGESREAVGPPNIRGGVTWPSCVGTRSSWESSPP
jgi:hypothetical protein